MFEPCSVRHVRATTEKGRIQTMSASSILRMGLVGALMSAFAVPALAADPEPQYGGEMIYAITAETFSLFPGRQNGSQAQDTWLYALEGLVEITEENEIIPWLAKSWSF